MKVVNDILSFTILITDNFSIPKGKRKIIAYFNSYGKLNFIQSYYSYYGGLHSSIIIYAMQKAKQIESRQKKIFSPLQTYVNVLTKFILFTLAIGLISSKKLQRVAKKSSAHFQSDSSNKILFYENKKSIQSYHFFHILLHRDGHDIITTVYRQPFIEK